MADVNDAAKSAFALSSSAGESMQKGMNEGASWAAKQASLDLQRQDLAEQRAQHDEMKRQFQVTLGKQMFSDMTEVALMNTGEVKNARMKGIESFAKQSGLPFDDTWTASLKDANFQPKWSELYTSMTGLQSKDPKAFDDSMSKITDLFGQKATLGIMEKGISGANMMNTAAVRAQATQQAAETSAAARVKAAQLGKEGRQATVDSGFIKAGQKSYDTEVKPIRFALEGAGRAMDLIKAVENPKSEETRIKSTKQLRSILANEEARLVTQKSNFGEGTAEAMQIDSYASRAKDLVNKIADEPGDTLSPENLTQAKNLYSELVENYMGAHDRLANNLLGGATESQKEAVQGRAKKFQEQYGKKFGGWKGDGVEGVTEEAKKEAIEKPLDPTQLEAARKLKLKLEATPAGPARNALMEAIQKSVSPEIRKKVGLQ